MSATVVTKVIMMWQMLVNGAVAEAISLVFQMLAIVVADDSKL